MRQEGRPLQSADDGALAGHGAQYRTALCAHLHHPLYTHHFPYLHNLNIYLKFTCMCASAFSPRLPQQITLVELSSPGKRLIFSSAPTQSKLNDAGPIFISSTHASLLTTCIVFLVRWVGQRYKVVNLDIRDVACTLHDIPTIQKIKIACIFKDFCPQQRQLIAPMHPETIFVPGTSNLKFWKIPLCHIRNLELVPIIIRPNIPLSLNKSERTTHFHVYYLKRFVSTLKQSFILFSLSLVHKFCNLLASPKSNLRTPWKYL